MRFIHLNLILDIVYRLSLAYAFVKRPSRRSHLIRLKVTHYSEAFGCSCQEPVPWQGWYICFLYKWHIYSDIITLRFYEGLLFEGDQPPFCVLLPQNTTLAVLLQSRSNVLVVSWDPGRCDTQTPDGVFVSIWGSAFRLFHYRI